MYSATAVSPRIEAIVKEFNQFLQRRAQIDAQIAGLKNELVRLNLLGQFENQGVTRAEPAWYHDGEQLRSRASGPIG